MRIAFDAKWFFVGHPSGRVFTRNVLESLIRYHPEHQYQIILNRGDRFKPIPFAGTNVIFDYASLGTNLTSNTLILPFRILKLRPDILVSQNFAVPCVRVPQLTIVFDVLFATDPQYFTWKERLYFTPIKPLLHFANGIITISNYCLTQLFKNGFLRSNQQGYVVPLGVDERFFCSQNDDESQMHTVQAKYGLPDRFILYVGRLNQRKNLGTLVRSLAFLNDKSMKLVLCGPTDRKMFDINLLIRELSLQAKVLLTGVVDDDDLPWIYRSADVCAYVSQKEGFGLPPLEAMASGVPVVVSSTSSLPEVCGDAAEYVNPEDPKDVARGLNSVLEDIVYRSRLKKAGIARARELSWRHTSDQLLEILINEVQKH